MARPATHVAIVALLLSMALAGSNAFAQTEDESEESTLLGSKLLTWKGHLDPTQSLKLPLLVDRTVRRLTVAVRSAAGQPSTLRRPAGQVAADRGTGVEITKDASGELIRVERPDVGTWELELRGAGDYSVLARVTSPLRFTSFDYVRRLDADPDGPNVLAMIKGLTHTTLWGEPVRGKGEPEAHAATSLSQDVASAAFTLESEQGALLRELSFTRDQISIEGYSPSIERYLGAVPLPTVPFKFVVSGRLAGSDGGDAQGTLYRREEEIVWRARTVGVEPATGPMHIPVAVGKAAKLEYTVRNRGASATFELSAKDRHHFVTGVTPEKLEIASGETATVTVTVQVPPDFASDTQNIVFLFAKQVDDAETANSGLLTMIVVSEDEMTEPGRRPTD